MNNILIIFIIVFVVIFSFVQSAADRAVDGINDVEMVVCVSDSSAGEDVGVTPAGVEGGEDGVVLERAAALSLRGFFN